MKTCCEDIKNERDRHWLLVIIVVYLLFMIGSIAGLIISANLGYNRGALDMADNKLIVHSLPDGSRRIYSKEEIKSHE